MMPHRYHVYDKAYVDVQNIGMNELQTRQGSGLQQTDQTAVAPAPSPWVQIAQSNRYVH